MSHKTFERTKCHRCGTTCLNEITEDEETPIKWQMHCDDCGTSIQNEFLNKPQAQEIRTGDVFFSNDLDKYGYLPFHDIDGEMDYMSKDEAEKLIKHLMLIFKIDVTNLLHPEKQTVE